MNQSRELLLALILKNSLEIIRPLSSHFFFSCVCGAHWLTDECDPRICDTNHVPVLCNWPSDMLKYYSNNENHRLLAPPVEIPIPWVTAIVRIDFTTKTVWLDTIPEWEAQANLPEYHLNI